MVRVLNLILLCCICLVIVACAGTPFSPELTLAERDLIESDNSFGLELFKEIIAEDQGGNVFISPLSVAMALAMTLNGADAETREAMEATLELSGLSVEEINESYKHLIQVLQGLDPEVRFQLANSIWYRLGFDFEQDFIDLNKTYFDAEVTGLDFTDPETVAVINAWVDENTNGKIEEIVDQIDPNVVMYLINAIYFKGTWTYQFDEEDTKDDLFNLPDGSQTSCKMMSVQGDFQYFDNSDFQIIDLPYGNGDFSMTVLLPKPGKDVDELIAGLNQESWDQWMNSLSQEAVDLELPRFGLEYEMTLNDALTALGMGIAFTPEADFSNMLKSHDLWIDEVKHKTFVEVNEEGTEAAAVTSVSMALTSAGSEPQLIPMRCDRPFLFLIQEHDSQTMLFVGKIVEPTLSA
jgi:serine protease inhibitor